MIELTVGLPMWKAKGIAWLALESLCRQEDVPCEWELLVCEEQNEDSLGGEGLAEYADRLKAAGCARVELLVPPSWEPLGSKWRLMADKASESSEMFLIQDADCYSHPHRLKTAHEMGRRGADWAQSPVHLMFDIDTGRAVVYDQAGSAGHATAADMALRTELARNMPHDGPERLVNNWMLNQCRAQKWHVNLILDTSDNWRKSLNVTGHNQITDREWMFSDDAPMTRQQGELKWLIHPYDRPLAESIPPDIVSRLAAMHAERGGAA